MADLTRARIEQLLARASEPEYAGTEFTIEDYELLALCSLALVGLAVQPRETALRTACIIHIEHDCARYIISSVGPYANGAAKADHHMRICQYLTAAFTGKIDPDRVYQWHPFYKELHDKSQAFTSRLKDDRSNEAVRELAGKFVDLAMSIDLTALPEPKQ